MNFYKKWVICKKIIQDEVSIYDTCECDIEAPDIHRFPKVDGLSTRPPDIVSAFRNQSFVATKILNVMTFQCFGLSCMIKHHVS